MENSPAAEQRARETLEGLADLPAHARAEIALVLLGLARAADFLVPPEVSAEDVATKLRSAGLHVANLGRRGRDGSLTAMGAAGSPADLDSLAEIAGSGGVSDHRRYGELMGFPLTAVEAYASGDQTARLGVEEGEALLGGLPNPTPFAFSRAHAAEELAAAKARIAAIYRVDPSVFGDASESERAALEALAAEA